MNAAVPANAVVLYARDMEKVAAFYCAHFGFTRRPQVHDDLIELAGAEGGLTLLVHRASKGHRLGQSCVKLVFSVDDLDGFKARAAKRGLQFGKVFRGAGYAFANARDPAKNPIQISRRMFLKAQA